MKKKTVVCRSVFDEKKEVPVEELAFRPSIYALVLKDNAILLNPQFDGWDFPGGGINLGETLDDALEREVREETGLSVKRDKLLYVDSDFYLHPGTKKYFQSIHLYYTGKDVAGEISTDNFDAHERGYLHKAEWVPIEKALTLKFINSVDSPALIRLAVEKVRG